MFKRTIQLLVLAFLLPITAYAMAPEWQIVPEESAITFTGIQNSSPLQGAFTTFTAKIFFDPDALTSSKVDLIVDMNSLAMSYAEAKSTLQSSDWFNIKLFPKAEFKAFQWKRLSDERFQAIGTLTIRDKTVPVTLNFKTENFGNNKKGITGSTLIKRTAFGVGQGDWAGTDEVKDDVTVNFKIVAVPK